MARKPSHLGAYIHPSPVGSVRAVLASWGRTGGESGSATRAMLLSEDHSTRSHREARAGRELGRLGYWIGVRSSKPGRVSAPYFTARASIAPRMATGAAMARSVIMCISIGRSDE